MAGGKSRKTGGVSKKLINRIIKDGKVKNSVKSKAAKEGSAGPSLNIFGNAKQVADDS